MIAPEGIPFVLGGAALTVVLHLAWPRWLPATLAGFVVTAFVAWFFRDPERTPPKVPGAVISPADGRIVFSGDAEPGRYYDGPAKKVSVFMSVLDVHVNRAPVSGKVLSVRYAPGEFLVASRDKASLVNEQNGVLLETPDGDRVAYVQIAGLVARRVVCRVREGQVLAQGERVGMIRFGSRVDVWMPASARLAVKEGDRVRAGESVVGVLR